MFIYYLHLISIEINASRQSELEEAQKSLDGLIDTKRE